MFTYSDPGGNHATGTMTWYLTQSHYPDTEPTSPCPILLIPSARLRSDKYQFDKLMVWLNGEPNSRSPIQEGGLRCTDSATTPGVSIVPWQIVKDHITAKHLGDGWMSTTFIPSMGDQRIQTSPVHTWSNQTNTWRFLARHSALLGLGKDWLTQCQNNVNE